MKQEKLILSWDLDKMKIKKSNCNLNIKLSTSKIFLFLIMYFIFAICFVYAQDVFTTGQGSAAFSNPQYYNPSFTSFSSGTTNLDVGSLWPRLNENLGDICRSRQDFLVQIVPGGCKPVVVRSDLLAEQDVPVFCQLQAIQINPTIKPEYIKIISVKHSSKNPPGVRGTTYYHTSNSFLSYNKLTPGFATSNNIGYAVIVLNRQPNENNLTEYVEGNLSLTLTYNMIGGFSLGLSEMNIPVMTDDEWYSNYVKYVFLNGKAYLRVDKVEADKALVSVYLDQRHKLESFTIEKGKSQERYLGIDYCGLGYKISYVDSVMASKKAVIEFNQNRFDVYEKQSFADSCEVISIVPYGAGTGLVTGSCKDGKGGQHTFTLKLGLNKAKVKIGESLTQEYEVGDDIFSGSSNKIYLGAKEVNDIAKTPFIILFALDKSKSFNDSLKQEVKAYANKIAKENKIDDGLYSLENNPNNLNLLVLKVNSKFIDFNGENVEFSGFGQNSQVKNDVTSYNIFEDYFKKSIDGYKVTAEDYGSEEFFSPTNGVDNFGVASLLRARDLASYVGDSVIGKEIGDLLIQKYPKEAPSYVVNQISSSQVIDDSEASMVMDVGGVIGVLKLISVENPDQLNNGIRVYVDGSPIMVYSNGDYLIQPSVQPGVDGKSDSGKRRSSIILDSFSSSNIKITGDCYDNDGKSTGKEGDKIITLGTSNVVCGKTIYLEKIDIQQNARIKLEPLVRNAGSDVNISYKIGIEKRAIKLTPEKTKERIKKLNETISKLQNISNSLANVVKTMKAACFITSAALQVKNLFSNLGGKAIARQEIMQGTDGWNEMCDSAMSNSGIPTEKYKDFMDSGPYSSLSDCYSKNSKAIEGDVNFISGEMKKVNDEIKSLEEKGGFVKDGGVLKGKVVYTDGAKKAYIKKLSQDLKSSSLELKDDKGENAINLGEIVKQEKLDEYMTYDQARDIRLYTNILNSKPSAEVKTISERKLYGVLEEVKQTGFVDAQASATVDDVKKAGVIAGNFKMSNEPLPKGQIADVYDGVVISQRGDLYGKAVQGIFYKGEKYYAVLTEGDKGQYVIDKLYKFGEQNNLGEEIQKENDIFKQVYDQHRVFQRFDGSSYNNAFKPGEDVVKYYETEPYKGMPAIVPFDKQKGWYAATKQTLPVFGNIEAYQESGRVSSFWLCNVGANGRVEFDKGVGDDICQMFNMFTGQQTNLFYGLSEQETSKLVNKALGALQQAANQYKAGVNEVTIWNLKYKVGNPATNNPGMRCQDFMSPSDCKLMFNVCDPVICPTSRCNLGGKFYVDDVVQSGIVGSLFLCLPNYKEGIFIPICLTGVQAGLDNYISILNAARDCLQENLDTGKYVGICDEITAIYTCEFFWKQAAPLMKVILPKLLESIAGSGLRGGGEYLNVRAAWNNMESSINYFTNAYGSNSIKAFKMRSTEEVGSTVCKSFASIKFAKKFQTLIEPDSPTQFSAWFDEIKQTTATVPATSQYKVYFHIYAGKDTGTYYSVYLKDRSGESFYTSTDNYHIDTNFVGKGQYVDKAIDVTGPAGFRQLCVRVNYEEKCGFKQVSTSFAVNYLRDVYIKNQITDVPIITEKDCISGSGSALAVLQPNLQAGVEDVINPKIYNRGIIRICATDNPGSTTEPGRWQDVGYCGNSKIRCWLDRNSVNEAITPGNIGLRNATISQLNELAKLYPSQEEKSLLSDIEGNSLFSEIEGQIQQTLIQECTNKDKAQKMVTDASVLFAKLEELNKRYNLLGYQSARYSYDKSLINEALARVYWESVKYERSQKSKSSTQTGTNTTTPISGGQVSKVVSDIQNQMNILAQNGIVLPNRNINTEKFVRDNILSSVDPKIKVNREISDWQITAVSGLNKETLWVILGIHFGINKEFIITGAGENTPPHGEGCHPSGNCFDLGIDATTDEFYNDWKNNISNFENKYGFPIGAILITDESGAACTGPCTGDHYHIKVDQEKVQNFISSSDVEILPLKLNIPEPYKNIFTEAGKEYNVEPELIAAVFKCGEHSNYKTDVKGNAVEDLSSNWPLYKEIWNEQNSVTKASGPFQFIPCTWSGDKSASCVAKTFDVNPNRILTNNGYGVDANGDGIAEVNNFKDSAYAAAKYLNYGLTITLDSDKSKQWNAAYEYNKAPWYADRVYECYNQLKGNEKVLIV